jgi:hypothetical protein
VHPVFEIGELSKVRHFELLSKVNFVGVILQRRI